MSLATTIKPLVKRGIKQALRSVNLYPFLPTDFTAESAVWRSILPDWTGLVERDATVWKSARALAEGGPRILIATSTGGYAPTSAIDSLLAVALTLRGAEIHNLLCDAALPGCMFARMRYFGETTKHVKKGPSKLMCQTCVSAGDDLFRPLALPTHRYSQLISGEELERARELSSHLPFAALAEYRMDGLAIGEQALAGALRFTARGNLEGEPYGEAILRHYFNAALLTAYASRRLLDRYSFDCVCMVNGIYVPHGIILQVARQHNVRIVCWSPAYRNQTFIFGHEDSHHHTMLTEPTSEWEDMPWTPEREAEIVGYLKSREYGTRDWLSYHRDAQRDVSAIVAELGIDFSRPCIGMLTNVMFDAQVLYPGNAFPNMLDWVLRTIRYFTGRTDLQLIIRVHPAEVRGGDRSRQPIVDEIRRVFPMLPRNVFVIPPESPISTYAIMSQCDAVIIYGTKTGLELASIGLPVIVAGEAWVRNKGLTLDASSPDEYFNLLDRLPLKARLGEAVVQRARKYAYQYFFRRMIPLPFLNPIPYAYELALSDLDELLPGRSAGLDVICNGILKGEKFIYTAESHPE